MLATQLCFILHCTEVISVDLCCPPNSHTIRHYVKSGQQDFGGNMTLAMCEHLGGNQWTIAWFYNRILLNVTERRTQEGLLNLILLPGRLTYKPVCEKCLFQMTSSPVTESDSGSLPSVGTSSRSGFEKLVFPSDGFVHSIFFKVSCCRKINYPLWALCF